MLEMMINGVYMRRREREREKGREKEERAKCGKMIEEKGKEPN